MGLKYNSYIIKRNYLACFFTACFFLTQCKKENLPPVDLKKEYFPLKISNVIVYDVDSTVYNDFNNTVTPYEFELKDTIVAELTEEPGRKTFGIERYKRVANGEWIFQKNYTRTMLNSRAEEFLNNERVVSFVFPPEKDKTWNGNAYNNLGEKEYRFTDVDVPQTINQNTFDSTATVLQFEDINLIREDFSQEVYAKNVGLVRKEIRAIDKNISTGQIIRGYLYLMQVKSFH